MSSVASRFVLAKAPTWAPAPLAQTDDLNTIVVALWQRYPGGVAAVVFAPASLPGWMPLQLSEGGTVIVVGMPPHPFQVIRDLPRGAHLGPLWTAIAAHLGYALTPVERVGRFLAPITWLD